jgi:hypothetical protein
MLEWRFSQVRSSLQRQVNSMKRFKFERHTHALILSMRGVP